MKYSQQRSRFLKSPYFVYFSGMHDYPPLVSGALILLFRHFSQRQEFLIAFNQVQPLVSDNDVNSYKQIKDDLDGLRLLVEKSELWVYKPKSVDEKPSSVNNKSKSSISSGKNSSSQVGSGKTSKFMVNGSIKEEDEGQDERQPSPGKTSSRFFFSCIASNRLPYFRE